MNILHVVSGRGPTGSAAAAITDAQCSLIVHQRVFIIGQKSESLKSACAAVNVPYIETLEAARGARRLFAWRHDVRQLRRTFRELAIDIVHVHRSNDQLIASASIGKTGTARLVRTWHRGVEKIPGMLLRKLALDCDGSICSSRTDAAHFQKLGISRVVYIHPAVDTTVFKPTQDTRVKSQDLIIGQAARWKRAKGSDRGQMAALDVFKYLPRTLEWSGMLLGRGEMEGELRREAYDVRKLPESRVRIVPLNEHSPSRYAEALGSFSLGLVFEAGSDGSSRPAVEMLACGVPILVADKPGLRELAEDSACAVRLLPDDPPGWAKAIERLLQNRRSFPELGAAARRRAEAVHSLKSRGEALAGFYREL